jgi:hypothetical protein
MNCFTSAGQSLGAIRIDDFKFQFYQQPYGWPGEKTTTDMPAMFNLRQDPFERRPSIRAENLNNLGGGCTSVSAGAQHASRRVRCSSALISAWTTQYVSWRCLRCSPRSFAVWR